MMKKGFTLIELMIVIAIIAVIAAIAIPGLLAAQRSSNERNASASLKTLGTAEADFRSNDREGNLINDFWTGDVQSLCIILPMDGTGAPAADLPQNIIKLIEPSVAAADGDATTGLGLYNAANRGAAGAGRPFTVYQAKAGYVYRAAAGDGIALPLFRDDTDGAVAQGAAYGLCHNADRFAFLTYPTSASSGKLAFIANQDGTMYKLSLSGAYTNAYAPTAAGATSVVAGSGSADLDAGLYPINPSAVGYSKMD